MPKLLLLIISNELVEVDTANGGRQKQPACGRLESLFQYERSGMSGAAYFSSQQLAAKKNFILSYLISSVLYLGLNLSLLAANFQDQEFIEENYYLPFHLLEFWAVFVFSVIEAFVLHSVGLLQFEGSLFQKTQTVLVWSNILFTMMTAVLFSLYPPFYEVPAHYMEYSAQILLTIVNFVFIFGNNPTQNDPAEEPISKTAKVNKYALIVLASFSVLLSLLQLLVYSDAIKTQIGGERAGHFIEFSVESLNAVIVIFFTLQKYRIISKQLDEKYVSLATELP